MWPRRSSSDDHFARSTKTKRQLLTGTYTDLGTQDTHELDIDWDGDGTFDQTVAVTGGTFTVTHQFLDDNPTGTASDTFNVNVRLRDDDGGVATESVPLTVKNVAPTITSLTITSPINENQTATLTGTYSDPGPLDTHELDIDWDGDGTFDQTVRLQAARLLSLTSFSTTIRLGRPAIHLT